MPKVQIVNINHTKMYPLGSGLLSQDILAVLKDKFHFSQMLGMQNSLLDVVQNQQGSHVLVRFPTGTGKSLLILACLLDQWKKDTSRRSLVLLPTVALVQQYKQWASMLHHDHAGAIQYCTNPKDGINVEKRFAIGTPSALIPHNCPAYDVIFLDEIDELLQPLRAYATEKQIEQWERRPPVTVQLLPKAVQPNTRIIGCSATMNRRIHRLLCKMNIFKEGDKVTLLTSSMENSSNPVKHYYKTMADNEIIFEPDTAVNVIFSVWERFNRPKSMFVFLPSYLSKKSLREQLLAQSDRFQVRYIDEGIDDKASLSEDTVVWIGSERDARGLDRPLARHVILLGMPSSPQMYLHVAGRVGRLSQPTLPAQEPMVMTTILPNYESLPSYMSMMKGIGCRVEEPLQ